jgi:hypothetical protein
MLIENKFSKHIIYAIGEIILVVIGILIAPQINTLKEENNNHTRETNYLKSIRNEMQNNLQAFNTEENRISEVIKNKELLLRVMNSTEAIDSISDKTIADLYMLNFNIPINTTIATGAINEIISSGGLQYIKNDNIRKLIASWDTKFSRIKLQETFLKDTEDLIEDLMFIKKLVNYRYFSSLLRTSLDMQKVGAPSNGILLKICYAQKNMKIYVFSITAKLNI